MTEQRSCPGPERCWTERARLNSLAAHHAGNRAMQDVEIGQLRDQLAQGREEADYWRHEHDKVVKLWREAIRLLPDVDRASALARIEGLCEEYEARPMVQTNRGAVAADMRQAMDGPSA